MSIKKVTLEQLDKISLQYFEIITSSKECWSGIVKKRNYYTHPPCKDKETAVYFIPKYHWLRIYCKKHKNGIKLSEKDIFYIKIKC